MTVGIAEIDAMPAARPIGSALDGDAAALEPLIPSAERFARDSEGDVQRAAAVVRRDGAARKSGGLARGAAAEQQQDAAAADRECGEPIVPEQLPKLEHLRIEAGGTRGVVDVERGLQNLIERGHGRPLRGWARAGIEPQPGLGAKDPADASPCDKTGRFRSAHLFEMMAARTVG